MRPCPWIHFADPAVARDELIALLHDSGVDPVPLAGTHQAFGLADRHQAFGLLVLKSVDTERLALLRQTSRHATVLVLAVGAAPLSQAELWSLLQAGASDVLLWPTLPGDADAVRARLQRAAQVCAVIDSPRVGAQLVGQSPAWRALLRQAVELALYSRSPLLITGETGTGKELIARLVHDLDPRPDKRELVVVDCTTLTPELSGSELFGHERGAFTGALAARDGAFALADGGTLFLDEVGELPPALQAQLLRVVQEGRYKRVGSNVWQHTDARLLAATHRDLEAGVADGRFRADLFHRLAGARCHAPPLRERREDILALAQHVQDGLEFAPGAERPQGFDAAVCQYLLSRDYPGNVRELRRVVLRLCQRHAGGGVVTLGDVPEDERPQPDSLPGDGLPAGFEAAIGQAIERGLGLKEIGLAATECAIRLAVEQERGNLHRAAQRLRVTDRALQLRRAQQRPRAG